MMNMFDLSSASSIDLKTAFTIAEGVKVNYFQENYICTKNFSLMDSEAWPMDQRLLTWFGSGRLYIALRPCHILRHRIDSILPDNTKS